MCFTKSKKTLQFVILSVIFTSIMLSLWVNFIDVSHKQRVLYRTKLFDLLPTRISYSKGFKVGLPEFDLDENLQYKPDGLIQSNITITIISLDNRTNIVDVKLPGISHLTPNNIKDKRDVFVNLKDIKKSTKNIFFVETKCATKKLAKTFNSNGGFVLNARQCCAIESTALTNLDRTLYILHSCHLSDDFINHSSKYVESLFTYPNVYVVRLNNSEIFLGTPIQDLYKRKELEASYYPIEHTSDALRLTLLWRYGGTYCDLDVVTIKSLQGLGSNWAGMQDYMTIASGVLNFEPTGPGHAMVERALQHMNRHFDGVNWANNGPMLITTTALKECNVSSVTEAVANCQGNFTVHRNYILYPVYYTQVLDLFKDRLGKDIVKMAKQWAYSVHIWNKLSHDKVCRVGSSQAYSLLAEEFCPQVYKNCGLEF